MAQRRKRPEEWDDLENRVGKRRTGKEDKVAATKVDDITVQRMATEPTGRLKKYEPLQTRDFVPFTEYFDLTIENIKKACERFYDMPPGSCDVLASDRGPSCTRIDQIKGKKLFMVRFLDREKQPNRPNVIPASAPPRRKHNEVENDPTNSQAKPTTTTKYAASLSVADLLRAGKLVKKELPTKIELEAFNIQMRLWEPSEIRSFVLDKERFARGGFRDAFKAVDTSDRSIWVVKRYHQKALDSMDVVEMTLEEHTRKQVQLHSAARSIAQKFSKAVPADFGEVFSYSKVYYGEIKKVPVTVEKFIKGNFSKLINNDGQCYPIPSEASHSKKVLYEKAHALVHYSFKLSKEKMMLLDIQGSDYNLYDPEIATLEQCDEEGNYYFCTSNLSKHAIRKFASLHVCNQYCKTLGLTAIVVNFESEGSKNSKKGESGNIENGEDE